MTDLINTDSLINDYIEEPKKDRQVNFNSPEFQRILEVINNVLRAHNIESLTYNSAEIKPSIYDTGKFGNRSIWRVTSVQYPALNNYNLVQELKMAVKKAFPEYVKDESIVVSSYKDKANNWQTTIKIIPGDLIDNTWTKQDLEKYGKDDEVTARLDALEDRMFTRKDDTRTKKARWNDYFWANIYEDKLLRAELVDITDLRLAHGNERFSLDPDRSADFIGTVRGVPNCKIEGKSTWEYFTYNDSDAGKKAFAKHFESIKSLLGSLHDPDYILFVNKASGIVICIKAKDYTDNWKAGKINIAAVD